MSRACATCGHPQRTAIEAEIVAGRAVRAVAAEFGVDHSSLSRHVRNHLPAAIRAAAVHAIEAIDAPSRWPTRLVLIEDAPPEELTAAPQSTNSVQPVANSPAAPVDAAPAPAPAPAPLGLLALARSLRDRALRILDRAEDVRDEKTALAAVREVRGIIDSLARLEPPEARAEDAPALANSSEWQRVRAAIIAALADYPEARLAVAEALAATGALQ